VTRAVFLHGFGADQLTWAGVRPFLTNVEITTLDLPGHGSSVSDLGSGSLNDLGMRLQRRLDDAAPAWLVGHSLGGGLVLWLAARYPERWKGLILLAPLGLGQNTDFARLLEYPNIHIEHQMQEFLESLVFNKSLIQKQFCQYALEQMNAPGTRSAMQKIVDQLQDAETQIHELLPQISEHDLDVTFVWGTSETVLQPDISKIEQLGELIEIANVGHIPHVEAPKDVNEILRAKITAR